MRARFVLCFRRSDPSRQGSLESALRCPFQATRLKMEFAVISLEPNHVTEPADTSTGASSALLETLPAETNPLVDSRRQEKPGSLLAYPATYALIGINVAVFATMSASGPVAPLLRAHAYGALLTASFNTRTLLLFGSSAPDLILAHGQWWRLLTANFVHVTPLHLLLNMWCLWNLGLFGEPLLGRPGLVAVYCLTGVAGMLQSFAFSVLSGQWSITAGASGAVFGLAGILIVLLSNRRLALPWAELRSLRRQVIFFAAANLVLGMAPGFLPALSPQHLHLLHLGPDTLARVDNSAHVGGFLSGLALGLPLFPRMTSGRSSYRTRQLLVFTMGALVLCLLCYFVAAFTRATTFR